MADDAKIRDSVSTDLNLSFLSAVPMGDTIRLETEVVRVGRNMAFLTANIYHHETNKLAVMARHTKFLMN